MKKIMNSVLCAFTSLVVAGSICQTAGAQSTELAERISEDVEIWGSHTVVSNVFTEIEDPSDLPEAQQNSADAIQVTDTMLGLAFRLNGTLPETAGNFNIHYFQDYFPYDKARQDEFAADASGIFIASYAYYEDYLENGFEVLSYMEPANIRFVDGDAVTVSDTDSIVILLIGTYPSEVQNDDREAYFLAAEKALLDSEQLTYIGEVRRIEQTYYYNYDGLEIVCTDADAAAELMESDLLAPYSPKSQRGARIMLPELFTDEARELRATVREDSRVLSAQIDYSCMTDGGADAVINGIYTEPTVLTLGDADGSGDITVDDAQITLQAYTDILAGKSSGLTPEQEKAADVDGNGEVTIEDAQAILRYYTDTLVQKNPTWDKILNPNQT